MLAWQKVPTNTNLIIFFRRPSQVDGMNSEAVDNLHNNQDAFNVKQEPGVQGGNGNQQKFNNFANSSSPAMGTTGANSGMPAPGSGDQFDPNLEIKQENGAKV